MTNLKDYKGQELTQLALAMEIWLEQIKMAIRVDMGGGDIIRKNKDGGDMPRQ